MSFLAIVIVGCPFRNSFGLETVVNALLCCVVEIAVSMRGKYGCLSPFMLHDLSDRRLLRFSATTSFEKFGLKL